MDKKEIIKTVGGIVVSVGVGGIVGNIVKATTPASVGLIKKVCIGVGTVVLSNMATDKAVEYSTGKMDDIMKIFRSDKAIRVEPLD